MRQASIDPAPRHYPPAVTLLKRTANRPSPPQEGLKPEDIETWLLDAAVRIPDMITLFEAFVWKMVFAGIPLDRASLHVGTLHPQLYGFAWNWNIADGLCDEVKVSETVLVSDSYKRSPLVEVLDTGKAVELCMDDPSLEGRYALVGDLRELGITHYLALPLGGAGYHNVATVATSREGGFPEAQKLIMERMLRLLALHVERHIAIGIAGNVLDTYLGSLAGRRVLAGSIKRGAGAQVDAVIWVSDLRGFTEMSGRLQPGDLLSVLNSYFELVAGTVLSHGGEVLKFMGDGLLAIFPLDVEYREGNAASAAVAAALASEDAVRTLNITPPECLADVPGWRPLRSGIGLHEGAVFFGNIGAPERLDFTVIGSAVNAASRVEGMSKQLGHSILMTNGVAQKLDQPLMSLGVHPLRGVDQPLEIFALKDHASGAAGS